jgi:predicted transcriptional regulator
VYGKIVNSLNSELSDDEWKSLSDGEKNAIQKGLLQAEKGNVNKHEAVVNEFFKKYGVKYSK